MWNPFWPDAPWDSEVVRVCRENGAIDFEGVPILAEHISISPHDLVQDHRHRYSFEDSGNDLCFHSPTALPEEAITLGMYLNSIEQAFLGDEGKVLPDTAFESLRYLTGADGAEETPFVERSALDPEDPIGSWLLWGDSLWREYNIEQFAIINWGGA